MPNLQSVRSAIELEVRDRLVPALLEAVVHRHKRHAWRTCLCTYCQIKRQATFDIANMGHIPRYGRGDRDLREEMREAKRVSYRLELQEADGFNL